MRRAIASDAALIKEVVIHTIKEGSPSAEKEFGVVARTARHWVEWYKAGDILVGNDGKSFMMTDDAMQEAPADQNVPIEKLLEQKCEQYEREHNHIESMKWREVRPTVDGPVGIAMIGDPHLDDDGCNMPLLLEHVDLLQEEGVYAINLGDTTNNWVSRLQHLWANQRTNKVDAVRLAEWFLSEAGIRWLAVIYGNHDLWSGSPGEGNPLDYIIRGKAVPHLWEAQIKVKFSNGRDYKIWASHSFPGSSIWNKIHGMTRAQKMGPGGIDCYAQGHHHEWDVHHGEDPDTGEVFHLIKARGYKDLESHYNKVHGYRSQRYGASPILVINPDAEGINYAQCFPDLEEGVKYLRYLRS